MLSLSNRYIDSPRLSTKLKASMLRRPATVAAVDATAVRGKVQAATAPLAKRRQHCAS